MTLDITHLTDDTLITETTRAAATERSATSHLLTLLIEVERRKLHLSLGHSSMFVFCTRTLRLSEQAAYSRITAARAARRFPAILDGLTDGTLSLSSVGILAPHLTDETADAMLEAAGGKSTREVERLIASWHPQPDVPSVLRALPAAQTTAAVETPRDQSAGLALKPAGNPDPARPARPTPCPRAIVAPIAERRYLLRVTIDQHTHDKLQRARDLLRHSIPDGDTATILDRALGALIVEAERTKCARTQQPRQPASRMGHGRHIPAAVKREVWQRDGGRCVFRGAAGLCGTTAFLEYHHVVPFAAGGETSVANLELRCRAHNQYEYEAESDRGQQELWA